MKCCKVREKATVDDEGSMASESLDKLQEQVWGPSKLEPCQQQQDLG